MKSLLAWTFFIVLISPYESRGADHTVIIEAMKFAPAKLIVKQGDKITWVNKDFFPHTVTSLKNFNSKNLPAEKSWSYVPSAKGNFPYKCLFHPTMKGLLVVE